MKLLPAAWVNSGATTQVKLRYTSDAEPGIARLKRGSVFVYRGAHDKPVKNKTTLARIRILAIPPAWTDVWICPAENGHLQATGHDARGRKQYRYHPAWRVQRDRNKYAGLQVIAAALPKLRRRVRRDLRQRGMTRDKVLATVVRALETTLIRVGNQEYARTNGSYGLTTLRNHHARVRGSKIEFKFCGKSGIQHAIVCDDAQLARIVRRCQDLPGRELFAYLDDQGKPRDISSTDVNKYLQEATGVEITAKDFRTWAGTLLALRELKHLAQQQAKPTKRQVDHVVAKVAERLGNTKTVCRKCYIHPAVLDSFLEGSLHEVLRSNGGRERIASLRNDEMVLVRLLKKQKKMQKTSVEKPKAA